MPPVRVLVAAASRHGATTELAAAIADGIRVALGRAGEVISHRPRDVADVSGYDAVVLGSAVYFGHWLEDAHDLLLRCAPALWERPVWLFSSGPVGVPGRPPEALLDVDEERRRARARGHRVCSGRIERDHLPLGERNARRPAGARGGLPRPGDSAGVRRVHRQGSDRGSRARERMIGT